MIAKRLTKKLRRIYNKPAFYPRSLWRVTPVLNKAGAYLKFHSKIKIKLKIINMDIVKILTKERKLQKVSQQKVANFIGISKSLISRLESGKSIPNYNFIQQYADLLGYEIRLLKK